MAQLPAIQWASQNKSQIFLRGRYIEANTFTKIIKSCKAEISCLRKWYVLSSLGIFEMNLPRMLHMGWGDQLLVETRTLKVLANPES